MSDARLAGLLVVLGVLVVGGAACSRTKRGEPAPAATSAKPGGAAIPYAVATKPGAAPKGADAPKPKRPPPPLATARPAGFDLKASLAKGDAVELRAAVAYRYAGSQVLHVLLSTHARTCTDVRDDVHDDAHDDEHEAAPGEHQVELWIAPQLRAAEGTPQWAIVMAAHESPAKATSLALRRLGDAKVEPDTLAADAPAGDVRVTVPEGTALDDLKLAGTIVARGCGTLPSPSSEPAPDEQPGLVVEIAGKRLAAKSAFEIHDRILLSSDPADCKYGGLEPQVTLTLERDGTRGRLGGFLAAPASHSDTDDTLTPPLTITTHGRKAGRVEVVLEGSTTISGLPVKVSGKANLVACD